MRFLDFAPLGMTTPIKPRRQLGLFDATMIVMGGIVGAGIFANPSEVAHRVHTPFLILGVWVLGGLIAMCGAFIWAELATRLPAAEGGQYVYLREAYHPAIAFMYGWGLLLVTQTGGMAAVAVIFASYFRALTGADWSNSAIAAVALHMLTGVNCFGARAGSNVQSALMLLKIGAIAALVVIGFAVGHPAATGLKSGVLLGQPASFDLVKSIGAAMVPIAFAYGGWQTATFVAGEMRDARRDLSRGLLIGTDYQAGKSYRGVWGLYGSYDYISPYLFRVSSTALSLGTTRQYWIAPDVALQGSLLGGAGYGAAGSTTTIPSTPTNAAIRDYHFGVTPQALATMRLIASDRLMIDIAAREYYVSGLGSDEIRGSETIFRGNFGFNVRVIGGHALGVRYVSSTRDARYGTLPNKKISEGTFTFAYSFLGPSHFGAVKW